MKKRFSQIYLISVFEQTGNKRTTGIKNAYIVYKAYNLLVEITNKVTQFSKDMIFLTQIMCNQNRKLENRPLKKLGRPCMYKDREVVNISLPRNARIKAEELKGKQPLATFLTEQLCEKLGVDDIYAPRND